MVTKKLKVLIVDDEYDLLVIASKEFRKRGHEVVVTMTGNDAINIIKKEKVDIIVSDFSMPNGTGMDILHHVRVMDNPPLFFFFTAEEHLTEECLKAGAIKCFIKPYSIHQIIAEVEKYYDESLKSSLV